MTGSDTVLCTKHVVDIADSTELSITDDDSRALYSESNLSSAGIRCVLVLMSDKSGSTYDVLLSNASLIRLVIGSMADDIPHSWSIVDPYECFQWISSVVE